MRVEAIANRLFVSTHSSFNELQACQRPVNLAYPKENTIYLTLAVFSSTGFSTGCQAQRDLRKGMETQTDGQEGCLRGAYIR